MSFYYIKKDKQRNEGIFVALTESEDLSENLEKGEDDSVENWNKIVANVPDKGPDQDPSTASEDE